jgi:hypothetical protein
MASDQAGSVDVKAVAAALANEAAGNPQLRSDLESWQAQVQVRIDGDVSNSVTGKIHGKVVQARDIGSVRIE